MNDLLSKRNRERRHIQHDCRHGLRADRPRRGSSRGDGNGRRRSGDTKAFNAIVDLYRRGQLRGAREAQKKQAALQEKKLSGEE